MSDFFNSGWSIFIGAATVIGLLGCLWLLFVASNRTPMASDNTTGHVYDEDLVEMNNPLPRWWMVLFILTVVFALVYVFLFPALGGLAGSLGWLLRVLGVDRRRRCGGPGLVGLELAAARPAERSG